jgi:hypothetical protein
MPNGYWSKRLQTLTENRNRTMRDAINKAATILGLDLSGVGRGCLSSPLTVPLWS